MRITKTITWALAFSILAASLSAAADRDDHHDRDRGWDRHDDRGGWHGDIRHFRDHDFDRWRGGHWNHGYHDGRLGWWWVVAGLWYFYPQQVVGYPDPYTPPVVIVQPTAPTPSAPPPAQYWYYCDAAKAYYPYVQGCARGWRMVPATPAGAPGY
ncbi:MAG: hypothetical protein ACYC9K_05375 [Sulfuricaulis sp.]